MEGTDVSKRTCRTDDCTEPSFGRGLCLFHFREWEASGRPGASICCIDGCNRPYYSGGMCQTHNLRSLKGRPLDAEIRGSMRLRICSVPGCTDNAKAKDMCEMHYNRARRGRPLTPPRGRVKTTDGTCSLDGCFSDYYASGFCKLHYGRAKTGKPLERAEPARRRHLKSGYVTAYVGKRYPSAKKNGYMLEHRYVMERYLGRHLLPEENVHHKNGVRHDNRLENLELWVTSQPSGQRPADLVAWAHQVIERYASLPEGI